MRRLLKNNLIQSWIIFTTVLVILFIVVMFITPRKSVYLEDDRLSESGTIIRTECKCLGFKDALNETTRDKPFYEERCLGLVLGCSENEIEL